MKTLLETTGEPMVERIKRAFEDLEPPVCPLCHIDMKWTLSTLVERDAINHVFHCPSCHRRGEATSKIEIVVVPPDKLAAPRFRRAA